ncbi:MAG: hypothetical protein Q9P90_15595 [candidate division KSB1 bacterium]|nr:hypothetical protein [candidate division KSB1 bacterium]
MVASQDLRAISTISALLAENNFTFEILDGGTDLIKKIIDHSVNLVVLDADLENHLPVSEVVSIIRKAREKIFIVIIANQISLQLGRKLAEYRIALSLLKPINRALFSEFLTHLRQNEAIQ